MITGCLKKSLTVTQLETAFRKSIKDLNKIPQVSEKSLSEIPTETLLLGPGTVTHTFNPSRGQQIYLSLRPARATQ